MLYIREPGGTKVSEKIRKILLDHKNDSIAAECEMLLYMAARAQLVAEVIEPALKKGKIVICDRFLDSTLAYQGYGLGIGIDLINRVGEFANRCITPNLTILLDLPVKKGLKHRALNKDRIESRSLDYHRRVREGYLSLARKYAGRIKIVKVDSDKNITQVNIRALATKLIKKA